MILSVLMILVMFFLGPYLIIEATHCIVELWSYYDEYKESKKTCDVVLKFDTFLNYYCIAPDEYTLEKYTVKRKNHKKHTTNNSFTTDNGHTITWNTLGYYETTRIGFGYIDTLKYRAWIQDLDKQKELKNKNRKMKEYLELVQEDINRIRGKEND